MTSFTATAAVMPATIPEFDHFTPASWLIRHPQALDAATDQINQTLARAEAVFVTLNKLVT